MGASILLAFERDLEDIFDAFAVPLSTLLLPVLLPADGGRRLLLLLRLFRRAKFGRFFF